MHSNRIWRWAVLAVVLTVFAAVSGFSIRRQEHSCMGVELLTHKDKSVYGEYAYADLLCQLTFNGEPAPVDAETSTIYISQNITSGTRMQELSGELEVDDRYYMLRFLPDPRFEDLASAVKDGYGFTLLALCTNNTYMEYRVVFTTLPVLRVDGAVTHKNEDNEDVQEGTMCLWTPAEPETGRSSVQTSALEWHVRGKSSKDEAKKSWKLSLRDQEGLNNDLNFLGLGKDDDWILNALVRDETKVKEKLFMDLWNAWTAQSPWSYDMSTGEYVEVVSNGRYSGVYLLQRRLDRKYYRLSEHDILLKGVNTWFPETVQEAYDIVYTPYSEAETLALMEGIFTGNDVSMIQLDNFLDINVFFQYSAAIDNVSYKNVYYLLKWQEDAYQLYLIPWDTDMTWGVVYKNTYVYDYQRSMNSQALRREYVPMLREFPDLKSLMAFRWEDIRQTVFSEEYILGCLEESLQVLDGSGVLARDKACWGLRYGGMDTRENLTRFLRERLHRLDEYYAQ